MSKLEPLAEGLFTTAQHHSMMGLHLGTRMTVLRLAGGGVWLHSPIAMTDALKAEVDQIGPVSHIVVPNLFHHVYAGPWIAAYPEATTHAPAAMRKKRADLRIDLDLGAGAHPDWEGALVPVVIEGCMLEETVFVHPESRTVISVDLLENFVTSPHWPTRQYLKIAGIHGRPGWSRLLRPLYRDRRAARRSVDTLLQHEFDKVILAHGDIVRADGPDAVRTTFEGWL